MDFQPLWCTNLCRELPSSYQSFLHAPQRDTVAARAVIEPDGERNGAGEGQQGAVVIVPLGLHGQRAGRPPVQVPGVRRRGDEEVRRRQERRPRQRVSDGALRKVEASRDEPRRLAGGLPKIAPFSIDFQDIPFMIRPFRRNLRQIERSSIIGVFL